MKKRLILSILCMSLTFCSCGKAEEKKIIDSASNYYQSELGFGADEAKALAEELYDSTKTETEVATPKSDIWYDNINPIFIDDIDNYFGPTVDHTFFGCTEEEIVAKYGTPVKAEGKYLYYETDFYKNLGADVDYKLRLSTDIHNGSIYTDPVIEEGSTVGYFRTDLLASCYIDWTNSMVTQDFINTYFTFKDEYIKFNDDYAIQKMTYSEIVELTGSSGIVTSVGNGYISYMWTSDLQYSTASAKYGYYIIMSFDVVTAEVDGISGYEIRDWEIEKVKKRYGVTQ